MNGVEHYKEAERLVAVAAAAPVGGDWERHLLAAAQVHATLAAAAAAALPAANRYYGDESNADRAWARVIDQ